MKKNPTKKFIRVKLFYLFCLFDLFAVWTQKEKQKRRRNEKISLYENKTEFNNEQIHKRRREITKQIQIEVAERSNQTEKTDFFFNNNKRHEGTDKSTNMHWINEYRQKSTIRRNPLTTITFLLILHFSDVFGKFCFHFLLLFLIFSDLRFLYVFEAKIPIESDW